MAIEEPYTMLLASLPHLPTPIPGARRHLPISRLQLEGRLKWLTPEDRERMTRLDAALHFSQLPVDFSDAQVMERAQRAIDAVDSEFLCPIMLERLEMRTFVAALRLRAHNKQPPRERRWGIGRFVRQIETHYSDPAFGLGHLYPWIAQAHKHLQANEPMALENLLMIESWRRLDRVTDRHDFGFDAVALYVMRWDILHQFTRNQPEPAMSRFDALVEQALEHSPVSLETLA